MRDHDDAVPRSLVSHRKVLAIVERMGIDVNGPWVLCAPDSESPSDDWLAYFPDSENPALLQYALQRAAERLAGR